MIDKLNALLAPALMERLTLVVNHVLASEPDAVARLLPHQGRTVRLLLESWPRLLPTPPVLAFRITPAGLVEWAADEAGGDLLVRIDAGNPAALALRMLAGEQPAVAIEGDAQLATDIDWLLKNLRWDVAADLERLFGPAAAHELHRLGSWFAKGLRAAIERATALAGSMRSR
ncbi:hypothetical protein [Aquabacterium sp.]|uniref:hypothetical protein n=1 Tax=Aquabacterium sp. TaxID=1872578 RepID=UPI002C340869|nr:hypothetical protein [Aquabacterium sp.]HSW09110.1 hypothetical protein [Aquabacterium sp.]